MNSSSGAQERPIGGGFRHDALLYAGDEQFVGAVAGFLRDGLERDEPALVAVIEPRASSLRAELGADAGDVEFLDMWSVGRNPARIVPAWQDWVDRNRGSGRRFRGVGEPVWPGRSPAELVECRHHEQLLNFAFDDMAADGAPGWWLLCPYDAGSLPADVIAQVHETHPGLLAAGNAARSTRYSYAQFTPGAMFAAPLPEPDPADVLYQTAFSGNDLPALRRELTAHAAAELGLGPLRAQDLVLTADELAANSIRHGGGSGTLRLWHEGRSAVCEVKDRGLITDPLIGRRRPGLTANGGAGLWIANQLCDLLQIRSTPQLGTIVRAHFTDPVA